MSYGFPPELEKLNKYDRLFAFMWPYLRKRWWGEPYITLSDIRKAMADMEDE